MNALVYVNIDQSIYKGEMKVARNEKRKKLLGFSFYINIGNCEAFLWNLNLSPNHLFWRCAPGQFLLSVRNGSVHSNSKNWIGDQFLIRS